MKELINIHIGQAGVQIGSQCWNLFSHEHHLNPDGTPSNQSQPSPTDLLFYETQRGRIVPRTLFIDLDPMTIDEVKTGPLRDLFSKQGLISGKEDAANNFIRGHYTLGKSLIDQTLDSLRHLTENCQSLQGFMIYNSLGGGTGSGMGTLLEQRMSVDYGKKPKVGFKIFNSPTLHTSVVQPYNEMLNFHQLIEHQQLTLAFDNESLYKICINKLGIQNPNYTNINQLIAQVASSITAPMRFAGTLNADLDTLQTNLIPYPRTHFILPSFSPFVQQDKQLTNRSSVSEITTSTFSKSNQMIGSDLALGKFLACSLLYRGDVTPKEAINSVAALRNNRNVNFVNWNPTGFKVSINDEPMSAVKGGALAVSKISCSLLSNNTSIQSVLNTNSRNYDMMYAKRAFVHWYVGEGLDEGFFSEARQDCACLLKDYEEIVASMEEQQFQQGWPLDPEGLN